MRNRSPDRCSFQRRAPVRLRGEAWGGFAFDRCRGNLLELDGEGFAVLAALAVPHTLCSLHASLRCQGLTVRLPRLAAFVGDLERRGFVQPVAAGAPELPVDPQMAAGESVACPGLRAPLVAHWAPTYRCNLRCPFCYSESGPFRDPGPRPALRLRVVERLAAWGVLEVALGGGEPTLLPDFPDLLAAIPAAGMVPNVTTNGTVHRPAVVRALAEHAGVVHVSADRPDFLDTARGAGVFARLAETAQQLRAAGVPLGVNLLLTPEHVGNLRPSLDAAVDLGVMQITFLRPKGTWPASHWEGFPSSDDLAALAADLRAFLRSRPPVRLYVDTALRGEWVRAGLLDDPEPEVLGCGGGQRHVAVTPEGEVYPCSHARHPRFRMGSLLADSIEALWQAGPGRAARRSFLGSCSGVECACRPGETTILRLCGPPHNRRYVVKPVT